MEMRQWNEMVHLVLFCLHEDTDSQPSSTRARHRDADGSN